MKEEDNLLLWLSNKAAKTILTLFLYCARKL